MHQHILWVDLIAVVCSIPGPTRDRNTIGIAHRLVEKAGVYLKRWQVQRFVDGHLQKFDARQSTSVGPKVVLA